MSTNGHFTRVHSRAIQNSGFPDRIWHGDFASVQPKPLLKSVIAMPVLILLAANPVSAVDTVETIEFDIPTGAAPSPLFGAQPFTTQLLRFEEFGFDALPNSECSGSGCPKLPPSVDCGIGPDAAALDDFLKSQLYPLPTGASNQALPSAWHDMISQCVRPLATSYAEGRPPGEFFSHQRWDEFFPEVYIQTAQAGARRNGGMRDTAQLHGYSKGEFGSGGLYHNTVGATGFDATTKGIDVRLHPNLPIQDPRALWTFDGTFPPKLVMARYGVPILFRHHNALPIDPSANFGFGAHTITTHEHNGHTPAESDGYAGSFFFPGQFYDYRWPMILAGHDHINKRAKNIRAGTPDGNGGIRQIPGDWRETMSTHWFHDHMLDFTAQNVYKGNAAMMNYYSAIDRGREPKTVEEAAGLDSKPGYGCHYESGKNVNLCLPSGSEMDWGNRDYDVNLMVADKAWDQSGQLFFNIFNLDGFIGDHLTVNWLYKPYLDVRARRYRFRILNASVSRFFKIALVNEAGKRVPFYMIANDGNLMEHAVKFPNDQSKDLPEQGIAERYDIIIDFKNFQEGEKLYLVNILEHHNGKGPSQEIPLGQVLNGRYPAGKIQNGVYLGDPAVGKFLEFRVHNYDGVDLSMDPRRYVEGRKRMIRLPNISSSDLANATHRTFDFGRSSGTDSAPWTIKTDGGQGFGMDPHRLSAAPEENQLEIWHLKTGGGWSHPVHIHFEEGQILKRGGVAPPVWEKWARKDVYRIGDLPDSTKSVDLAIRFREFQGTYMEHCHNTQHEDHAMLLRWDAEKPGQTISIPTPIPRWEGVEYEDTVPLPSFKTGDQEAAAQFQLP